MTKKLRMSEMSKGTRAKYKQALQLSGIPLTAFMFLDKVVVGGVPVGTTELFMYRGKEILKINLPAPFKSKKR